MKKRIIAVAMAVCTSIALTGCGDVVELSDKDKDMVAEYIAGSLLKHSMDYNGVLKYNRDVLTTTSTPMPASNEQSSKPVSTKQPDNEEPDNDNSTDIDEPSLLKVSLSDMIGSNAIKINQTSSKISKSYTSEYTSIDAGSGKKLLIVNFSIKNISSENASLNLTKKNISYKLSKDDKEYGKPLLTIASEDLQYYDNKINAGESKKGLLIFEVKSSFKPDNAVIKAVCGDEEADITIK